VLASKIILWYDVFHPFAVFTRALACYNFVFMDQKLGFGTLKCTLGSLKRTLKSLQHPLKSLKLALEKFKRSLANIKWLVLNRGSPFLI
jgi:hypothetical protein